MQLDVLTYSSGTCLCMCEKKYQLRYERMLRPRRDDFEARTVGTWMHDGIRAARNHGLEAGLACINELEANEPAIGPDVFKIQQRACRVRAMIRVACEKWPPLDGEALTEHVVDMPVVNPDGGTSRTFRYCGVLDGLDVSQLVDWKRVNDTADFIRSKTIGYQTELYAAALAEKGIEVHSARFRLITEPTIRFCNKDGGSTRLYEDRCVEWLKDDPSKVMEHEMYVNPGRIREARYWLWNVSKRILENRRTGRWLRNEFACRTWNRMCEYSPICEAEASGGDPEWIIGQEFEVIDDPHPELERAAVPT